MAAISAMIVSRLSLLKNNALPAADALRFATSQLAALYFSFSSL